MFLNNILKPVFLIAIVAVAMIGVMIPNVFAENEYTGKAYEVCTSTPGSETLTREELDECILETEQYLELNELRGESRNTETFSNQILALGGVIAICIVVFIVILKFLILKK